MQIFYFAAWICIAQGVAIGEHEVGLVLAACLHVGLAVWFVQSLQRIPGKRLVVLRVFGLDKNAQFLFDGVLAFWKHFGHFFTVVDPAYWRHSHRVFSLGTLAFVALAVLSIATGFWLYGMLPGNPHEDLAPLAASVFALPLLAGYAWFAERQVDRTFIRSKAHLVELLARFEKRPRNRAHRLVADAAAAVPRGREEPRARRHLPQGRQFADPLRPAGHGEPAGHLDRRRPARHAYAPGGQERERFEFGERFPAMQAYSAQVRCETSAGRYSATLAYDVEQGRLKSLEWRSRLAPAGHSCAVIDLMQEAQARRRTAAQRRSP